MKTLTFSILMMYTIHCISQPHRCDGQIHSGWGNPMKSRYLLGKFFPVLPEFYPATLNEEVSLTVHKIYSKIYISKNHLYFLCVKLIYSNSLYLNDRIRNSTMMLTIKVKYHQKGGSHSIHTSCIVETKKETITKEVS